MFSFGRAVCGKPAGVHATTFPFTQRPYWGNNFPPPFLTILFFSCFFTFPFTMSMSELSTPSIPTTFYNNHAANITSPSMLSLAQTHSNQSVSCVLTQFRHISEHVESDGSWSEMASMSGNNTKTVCLPRVKLL